MRKRYKIGLIVISVLLVIVISLGVLKIFFNKDEELKKGKLKEKIEEILNNKEEYNLLKQNAEILGANFKQANEKILNLILEAI